MIKRVSKASNRYRPDEAEALKKFTRSIFDLKRKRRTNFFIPTEVIFTGKTRDALQLLIKQMEKFRCETIVLNDDKFYRLAAEFILIPSERKYYSLKQIFSLNPENSIAEEFQSRIKNTLTWISDVLHKTVNTDEIINFINEVHKKCKSLNFKNAELKSKNWYCIVAILAYAKKMGWSKELLIQKFSKFYDWRTKNTLPEAVLMDVVNGELDTIDFNDKKKLTRKYDYIRNEDFVKEWEKNLRKNK
jgi:hypothetical protein